MRPYLDAAPFPRFNWSRAKAALDEASNTDGWVLHDLRRTGASIMAAAPISAPPHLIERVLNHVTGSGTALSHIYNRYRYENEMRQSLECYHDHLILLSHNATVRERCESDVP